MNIKKRRLLISSLVSYMDQLQREFVAGMISEPDYATLLHGLLQEVCEQVTVVTTTPDSEVVDQLYLVSQSDGLDVYICAEDFGTDLDSAEMVCHLETLSRELGYVLATNYLDFRWYINGQRSVSARLGKRVRPGGRPSLRRIPGGVDAVARLLDVMTS